MQIADQNTVRLIQLEDLLLQEEPETIARQCLSLIQQELEPIAWYQAANVLALCADKVAADASDAEDKELLYRECCDQAMQCLVRAFDNIDAIDHLQSSFWRPASFRCLREREDFRELATQMPR